MTSTNRTGSREAAPSILREPDAKSVIDLLASASDSEIEEFLEQLSENALAALPFLFEHWAHADHQLAPEGDWRTWVIMGGRGAGKTRAGAEWIRARVEGPKPLDPGRCSRIALLAETYDQAREVMLFGDSGLMACTPADRRPSWHAGRRRVEWPNGASAQLFSARDPEALRGPQFDCAWSDELAKWKNGEAAWTNLKMALRLGKDPRQVVTTTPRNAQLLKSVLAERGTVLTTAPSSANAMYLAPQFLEDMVAEYGNTRMGRQELQGELIEDHDGALWTRSMIEESRVAEAPELDRLVVAVDPPVTSGEKADECGIIVAGISMQGPPRSWTAYVLADASMKGATPRNWIAQAAALYRSYEADRIVAEVNQGGDLVATLLQQVEPGIAYKPLRATRSKVVRAEPVAALYEQGRVKHVGAFPALEDQMSLTCAGRYMGSGSPDRVDALVWAITELLIEPPEVKGPPQVRLL